MGENSAIGWTDHTFNPWQGCTRVSPACNNCYAEAWANRFGKDLWGKEAVRQIASDSSWRQPLRWAAKAEMDGVRRQVFCASLADVFENRSDLDEPRARLWELIADTQPLDWLLLTKRPENVASLIDKAWNGNGWPTNVWLGCTVEDQRRADERIPIFTAIPARVRFLSCEPLLGPVDLGPWLGDLHWVIVGGESGRGARRLDPDAARRLVGSCDQAGVPVFMKQAGKVLGREWGSRHPHGIDLAPGWPAWARVRAFPRLEASLEGEELDGD